MFNKVDYALAYARLGWPVLPLHYITKKAVCSCNNKQCRSPGKHPAVKTGVKEASFDEAIIIQWWKKNPEYNIGIRTGKESDLVVVDIDISGDKQGNESLQALEDENEPLPDTLTANTGSNGRHILFKYPPDCSIKSRTNVATHIDIRSDNGYIVVEPSNHYSGGDYAFLDWDPLEEETPIINSLPDWLYKLLTDQPKEKQNKQPIEKLSEDTPHFIKWRDESRSAWHKKALQKQNIKDLWEGNIKGYPSHSEADMSLCGALAYWNRKDPVLMAELFRASGLYRTKWDEIHHKNSSGDSTYGQMTLRVAINSTTDTRRYPGDKQIQNAPIEPETEQTEPSNLENHNSETIIRLAESDLHNGKPINRQDIPLIRQSIDSLIKEKADYKINWALLVMFGFENKSHHINENILIEFITEIKKLIKLLLLEENNLVIDWNNIINVWHSCFMRDSSYIKVLNSEGSLVDFTFSEWTKNFKLRMFGGLFNQTELNQAIEKIESEHENKIKIKIKFHKELDMLLSYYFKTYRQREKINYETDMFISKPYSKIERTGVMVVGIHKPFSVEKFSNEELKKAVIDDYSEHYPGLNDFIELLAASRFAADGRQAFFWLKANSSWGKGFLVSCLKDLDIVCEMSVKEVEKAFNGDPLGRSGNDFMGKWVLFVDEFKYLKSEIKQLNSEIQGSPKNNMNFTAPLYMKLFASAEHIESAAGSAGVEEQFARRISLLPVTSGQLDNRELFRSSGKLQYKSIIRSYIAENLNEKVDYYRSFGRLGAANYADSVLSEFNKIHTLANYFGDMNVTLKELAESLIEYVRAWGEDQINNGLNNPAKKNLVDEHLTTKALVVTCSRNSVPFVFIKSPMQLVTRWIEMEIDDDQKNSVQKRKRSIADRLDHFSEDFSNTRRYKIYQTDKTESRKGIFIKLDKQNNSVLDFPKDSQNF